jgi:hypothetical protein
LINLAGVGYLDLLPQLYTGIWISDLVLAEYQAKIVLGAPDLGSTTWLTVQPVTPDPSFRRALLLPSRLLFGAGALLNMSM